ncbi:hypothetical protein Dsin_016552 [Dipteronia sinensis]|uniref:Uncharacterized protein n=1 Tax=Dipteronia sinensis TaxID=43782 RepID=A0AAE0ADY4_9ROSI|nr:hypothetical protein Dsin_016552 [Dipteronia sinensis]
MDVKSNDAIVVKVQIGHQNVRRVMIDNGSSADILHLAVYEQLGLDSEDLEIFHTILKRFGGMEIRYVGLVKLLVKIEKDPYYTATLLDFMVVDLPY